MTVCRWVLAGAVTIGLAGCSTAPPGYVGRFSPAASTLGSDPLLAGGARPLVTVPAALGSVLAVRETPYANGVAQDILIGGSRATAGENKIEVRIAQTATVGAAGERLVIPPPAAETIDDDLVRLFPGVEMHLAPEVIAGYGRGFSYASGHLGSTNCIFAWHYAAAAQPMTLLEGASGSAQDTTLVRLRLCRTLSMTALLDIVQQMGNTTGSGADPILGGAAVPEIYRRQADEPRLQHNTRSRSHAARHRSAPVRFVRTRRFSDEPEARGSAGSGLRIPLPGDVALPQAPAGLPGVATPSRPASDLPMPPS